METPRIVVVGGGAGGLELASRLGKRLGRRDKAQITLVDRDSTHIWKPLLHEVATGVLDQSLDETAYQGHGAQHGYDYQLGTLTGIDRTAREVELASLHDDDGNELLSERRLGYDYLVLALGSISNDFGTPGVADHCYFLDSASQAEAFRRAMLNTFLRYGDGEGSERPCLSIAIVGGGATGVELSAELLGATEMLKSYGYSGIGRDQLQVHLIEAAPRLLPALPARIGHAVHRQLEKMGIQIHLETKITQADAHGFNTADEQRIDADLTVWAAGVRGADVLANLGLSTAANNRIDVHQTLQSVDDERIFAIGDCAACPQGNDRMVPPRAQAAHQMADTLYGNLRAAIADKPLKLFHYRDLGSLISLSHFDAVGNLMTSATKGHLFIEGRLAKLFYVSLYRMHQRAIHGTFNTLLKVVVDRLNRVLRPNLKLH
ncbi:NAD(P)/FAD-dependent oxidoreductase [Salinisphaera sp. USBA-960]|uniref:NAD(P)/FAD-dependent oxidoreductase n=1 Tax=Salinisphaera orenii TaxID=856731 RepID=UPI000DBE45BB|nr:NAD(P)/FAD-dependent oxidoreductase [Salifodinibacter halophilus]NNC26062.1 NAD(P)/FAD-dependent oxidoreductase [Salifodinibacter halophilus]